MEDPKSVNFRLDNIDDARGSDWKKARYTFVFVLIVAALSGVFFAANLLRFELLTDVQSVVSILTPLVLYSIFIERAVEVFLTVWRGKEGDALSLAVKQEGDKVLGVKNADLSSHNNLQHKLTDYKSTTRDVAFVSCFILGILISLAGVRALALFVDPASLDDLSPYQSGWFTVLDIFITGALIGGGSDGIHKILSMFIAIIDSTKARAEAKGETK
jgi:hypothetical protein